MRTLGKLVLVLVATCSAAWLYNLLYDWAWENVGASYALGTLWQVVPTYGFLYLLCFAVVAVFGTTTPRKITNGSFVVLIGGFLPLFAMGLWEYTHTKIPYGEIMDLQKGAYTTLLVTNGIMLLLINIVAHSVKSIHRVSMPRNTAHSEAEASGRVAGTVYLGK